MRPGRTDSVVLASAFTVSLLPFCLTVIQSVFSTLHFSASVTTVKTTSSFPSALNEMSAEGVTSSLFTPSVSSESSQETKAPEMANIPARNIKNDLFFMF